MAINAMNSGGDFKPVEEGSHAAVCDMVVDLGIQPGGQYAPKHQVYLRFQIPDIRIEIDGEDKPAIIGRTFTLSLSEKSNLRPFLKSWRGRDFTPEELRGFDVTQLAGKPLLLSVTHYTTNEGQVRAEASAAMKLPRGMPVPKVEGDVIVYDEDNKHNWDKLRPWMKEKIEAQLDDRDDDVDQTTQTRSQTQDRRRPQPAAFDTDLDDDVPF